VLRRSQTICTDRMSVIWQLVIRLILNVPFITSLSAATVTACLGGCRLSRRQSCSAQGHDKTDSTYSCSTDAVVMCSWIVGLLHVPKGCNAEDWHVTAKSPPQWKKLLWKYEHFGCRHSDFDKRPTDQQVWSACRGEALLN